MSNLETQLGTPLPGLSRCVNSEYPFKDEDLSNFDLQ